MAGGAERCALGTATIKSSKAATTQVSRATLDRVQLTVDAELVDCLHKLLVHLHAPHQARLFPVTTLLLTLLQLQLDGRAVEQTQHTSSQGRVITHAGTSPTWSVCCHKQTASQAFLHPRHAPGHSAHAHLRIAAAVSADILPLPAAVCVLVARCVIALSVTRQLRVCVQDRMRRARTSTQVSTSPRWLTAREPPTAHPCRCCNHSPLHCACCAAPHAARCCAAPRSAQA